VTLDFAQPGAFQGSAFQLPTATIVAAERPPATLLDVLAQAGYVAVARLSVLWPDLSLRRAFDLTERIVTDATVTAELRRDVRRSASMSLVNVDGILSPALADDLFAAGSPVRLERGALVSGVPEYIPLMTGFITGSTASMSGTLGITVESFMSACAQEAGTALVLPAGTFLVDALHMLFDPVLPGVTWTVETGADERALGADIPVLATDSRLDMAVTIADALGVDVFDDRYGRIVVRLRPDRATQATARVMTEPLSLERTIGRTPVNAQAVEASPGESEPFTVLEEVDDPGSPIHRDRIGLRMAPTLRSDTIPDPATARATARAMLAERATAQDTLSVANLPAHLDLDEGDVIERTETITGTSGRYVVDAITYPVTLGDIRTTEVTTGVLFVVAA